MTEGYKVLVITGVKHHLLPGNEPDWHALRMAHPDRLTWLPDIQQGSSDLSPEPWHSGNNFGVHVHAAELAALLSVPLRNVVAVPDTATMMWVETARQNQDTLKNEYLMQNPPVGSHCHGQIHGQNVATC